MDIVKLDEQKVLVPKSPKSFKYLTINMMELLTKILFFKNWMVKVKGDVKSFV